MARTVTEDTHVHEHVLRDVLKLVADMDMRQPPPVMAQRIHRNLRSMTGVEDPYREAKTHQNRMALGVLADLQTRVASSDDPLMTAVRLAIAGNIIDMGVSGNVTAASLQESIDQALATSLAGDWNGFQEAAAAAGNILYLCDNAGVSLKAHVLTHAMGMGSKLEFKL